MLPVDRGKRLRVWRSSEDARIIPIYFLLVKAATGNASIKSIQTIPSAISSSDVLDVSFQP
jgi:hypothetical protein